MWSVIHDEILYQESIILKTLKGVLSIIYHGLLPILSNLLIRRAHLRKVYNMLHAVKFEIVYIILPMKTYIDVLIME